MGTTNNSINNKNYTYENEHFEEPFMMAAVMALCVTLFSCEKEKITTTPNPPAIAVDKYYLDFKNGDGPQTIKITTEENWTYSVDEEWVHVTRDGNGNKLTVEVEDNRTKETRGKTSNGTWAGKISWKECEISSSSTTRSSDVEVSSTSTMTKQNATKDHSAHKLSPEQYQLYMIK